MANPGLKLPALDIIPVVRADGSGTTYAFTNHLSAISKTWRDVGTGIGKVVRWPAHSLSARWNEELQDGSRSRMALSAMWSTDTHSGLAWP